MASFTLCLYLGLFVTRAVCRSGPRIYLFKRVWCCLYLYTLWTLIQGLIALSAGNAVNSPRTITSILDFLHPDNQLWFLPWLVVATTLAVTISPWKNKARAIISVVFGGAIGIMAWGYGGVVIGLQGLALLSFFLCGTVITYERIHALGLRLGVTSKILMTIGCIGIFTICLLAGSTPPTYGFDTRTVVSVSLGIIGSWGGCTAVILISELTSRIPFWNVALSTVGRHTLSIFIAHIIFASGTRVFLVHFGIESPVIISLIAIPLGLTAPLVVEAIGNAIRIPWLFTAPPLFSSASHNHGVSTRPQ